MLQYSGGLAQVADSFQVTHQEEPLPEVLDLVAISALTTRISK